MGILGKGGMGQNEDIPSGEETKCGTGEVGEEGYLISVEISGSSEYDLKKDDGNASWYQDHTKPVCAGRFEIIIWSFDIRSFRFGHLRD